MTSAVADRCTRARESAGLSLGQAASRLGMDRADLMAIEQDADRTSEAAPSMLPALAELYGVSLAWLRDGTRTPISEDIVRALDDASLYDTDRQYIIQLLETLPPGTEWDGGVPWECPLRDAQAAKIGVSIRAWRLRRGMSLSDLAAAIAVIPAYLTHVEEGVLPLSSVVRVDLEALGWREPVVRAVYYLAHPLAPTEEQIRACTGSLHPGDRSAAIRDGLAANLARAQRWLRWLRRSFPETTFIAPWIAAVLSGEDDADPTQREAGLVDACAVVPLLTGIVLCGGRVSSGMGHEAAAAKRAIDLTYYTDPPELTPHGTFEMWAGHLEIRGPRS